MLTESLCTAQSDERNRQQSPGQGRASSGSSLIGVRPSFPPSLDGFHPSISLSPSLPPSLLLCLSYFNSLDISVLSTP
jgi:hypothetical protein